MLLNLIFLDKHSHVSSGRYCLSLPNRKVTSVTLFLLTCLPETAKFSPVGNAATMKFTNRTYLF